MIAIGKPWRCIRHGAGCRLLDCDPPACRQRAPSSSPGTTRCQRIVVIVVVRSTLQSIGRAVAAVVVDTPSSASRNLLGDAFSKFPHLPPMMIVMTPPNFLLASVYQTTKDKFNRDWGIFFCCPRQTNTAVNGTQSVPDWRGGGRLADNKQTPDAAAISLARGNIISRQWQ